MKIVDVLSFDCANRSLAYTHASVNVELLKDLSELNEEFKRAATDEDKLRLLIKLMALMNGFITVMKSGVIDVMDGVKLNETSPVYRVKQLKKVLDTINAELKPGSLVMIEEQPQARNYKSSSVQDQIMMYYADYELMLMNPRLKNKICFREDLHHDTFKMTRRDLYAANKDHSKENFKYFIANFGLESMLVGVKPKNYDDLADSFMQIMSYVFL